MSDRAMDELKTAVRELKAKVEEFQAGAGPPREVLSPEVRVRLREQAERDFPEAWQPTQPGDEVAGTITAIRASVPTAYGPAPVVELAELVTQRPVTIWLIHTVLRNEFARARPVPGETILVRYRGRVQPEGGGPAYASYRLVVDRLDEGSDVDWNGIAGEHDPDLAEPAPAAAAADDDGSIPF